MHDPVEGESPNNSNINARSNVDAAVLITGIIDDAAAIRA